ncbi:hypothetical protein RMATCC62417_18240 [Rhizopus microsporus]|nr:hypothetical protein RMATCC62417_18240 [Rhizopus microsporus]
MSEDFQPYRLDTEYTEEIEQLVELQRRHTETRKVHIDNIIVDEDDDSFSVHEKHPRLNAPPVPDFRYEQQVEKTIKSLRDKGTSPIGIFWTIVIQDQIILPFVSGFAWCICSNAWKWYRTRGVVNKQTPKRTMGFFRGLQHGITEWTKSVYNVIISSTTSTIQ